MAKGAAAQAPPAHRQRLESRRTALGGPGRAVPHVVPENGQTKILSLFYHGRCFRESRFSATQAYSPSSRPLCHCDKNKMISLEISEKFEGLESVSPTSEQPLDLAAAG